MEAIPSPGFSVLQGNETLVKDSLKLGASGMVSALANFAPEWHADLYASMQSGDESRADELQQRICRLWTIYQLEPVGSSIAAFTHVLKVSLERRGWLVNTSSVVGGFEPTDHFRRSILRHLEDCELSVAVQCN
jgi:dihydrodipicolinate synthase/N-acetylneuraminate lyase